MPVHVLSTACDVISFNSQGQLCPLTCAEWRDLSNHTRMSTIQSRTPDKKGKKNHVTKTWKLPWKSCSTTHLPFLSSNPKIRKAFLKTFPTKKKPTKCPATEKKNEARKAKKEGRILLTSQSDIHLVYSPDAHRFFSLLHQDHLETTKIIQACKSTQIWFLFKHFEKINKFFFTASNNSNPKTKKFTYHTKLAKYLDTNTCICDVYNENKIFILS